jgi:DNA-binding PadR family transcriptional regulator
MYMFKYTLCTQMKKKDPLGQFEQLVLTAVMQLRETAYGLSIADRVSELGGREVSAGAVYMTLERMEEKGYVKSWHATPPRGRRGHPRRYFCLLAAGERVLRQSVEISKRITDIVDEGLEMGRWVPGKANG